MKIIKQNEKEWIKTKNYFKKILLSEVDLKSKGNLIQIVKCNAYSEIRPHYHKKTVEVYYILKGNAILFFGNKKIKTKPGDVFLCEPGDVHGIINNTSKQFILLVFKTNYRKNDIYWD